MKLEYTYYNNSNIKYSIKMMNLYRTSIHYNFTNYGMVCYKKI